MWWTAPRTAYGAAVATGSAASVTDPMPGIGGFSPGPTYAHRTGVHSSASGGEK